MYFLIFLSHPPHTLGIACPQAVVFSELDEEKKNNENKEKERKCKRETRVASREALLLMESLAGLRPFYVFAIPHSRSSSIPSLRGTPSSYFFTRWPLTLNGVPSLEINSIAP